MKLSSKTVKRVLEGAAKFGWPTNALEMARDWAYSTGLVASKAHADVKPGDLIVMTPRTMWRVISLAPYEGPLAELRGAIVATTDRGCITLEAGFVEVIS